MLFPFLCFDASPMLVFTRTHHTVCTLHVSALTCMASAHRHSDRTPETSQQWKIADMQLCTVWKTHFFLDPTHILRSAEPHTWLSPLIAKHWPTILVSSCWGGRVPGGEQSIWRKRPFRVFHGLSMNGQFFKKYKIKNVRISNRALIFWKNKVQIPRCADAVAISNRTNKAPCMILTVLRKPWINKTTFSPTAVLPHH